MIDNKYKAQSLLITSSHTTLYYAPTYTHVIDEFVLLH